MLEALVERLRELVRQEQLNSGQGAERFTVTHVDPLVLEQMSGDLVLHEDDPDVTVGAWVQQFHADYTLRLGDQVWALREGSEWHAIDVHSSATAAPLGGVGSAGPVRLSASEPGAPTSGEHDRGEFVFNPSPSEEGTGGAKYVVLGWSCLESGTPGVWVPARVVTGN